MRGAGDAPTPLSSRHIPALDGLRGVAIALVLAQNLYPAAHYERAADLAAAQIAWSGWVGVDLFFVLSGFLITGILLDTRGQPHWLRNFYARRVLRIFPLYYATLAFLFLVLPELHLLQSSAVDPMVDAQGWYWSYTVNLLIARSGWEAAPLGTSPFWSLAVEEQFYLVWAAVVLLCGARRLPVVCAAMIVGALGLRIWGSLEGVSPVALDVLTPTRMDALAVGALLAVALRTRGGRELSGRVAGAAAVTGALALLAIGVGQGGLRWRMPLVHTVGATVIAATAGAVLTSAVVARTGSRTARVLEHPALRFLGRYSYGIYVTHRILFVALAAAVPVIARPPEVFGFRWPAAVAVVLAVGALSIAAAMVSWRLVERPFLKLKDRFGGPDRSGAAGWMEAVTPAAGDRR